LVFAKGSIDPFIFAKGTTNIGQGILCAIIFEHPVKSIRRRLNPFVLQPFRRLKGVDKDK
jgi:hypothetical protein